MTVFDKANLLTTDTNTANGVVASAPIHIRWQSRLRTGAWLDRCQSPDSIRV
jgi:hypothetical protein